jgi:hypothetical protein
MKLDYAKLFAMREDFSSRHAFRARPSRAVGLKMSLLLGVDLPKSAIDFQWDEGSDLHDVIWTTYAGLPLVSESFVDRLDATGFTGWSTYPIILTDRQALPIAGYHGLSITGRAGPIDRERSQLSVRPPRVQRGSPIARRIGLFFRNDEWDGSDFSVPEGSAYKIVTERVVNALKDLDIPNVKFENLVDLERSAK